MVFIFVERDIVLFFLHFRKERAKAAKYNTMDAVKKKPRSATAPEMPSTVNNAFIYI